MPAAAGAVRNLVLGLLLAQPLSGYDIKKQLQRLDWLMGSVSYGTVYPSLSALLQDGLVTADIVGRPGRPARKLYAITEAGRSALAEWLDAASPGVSMRDFVTRLIPAANGSEEQLRAYLDARRSRVLKREASMKEAAAAPGAQAPGERLALDYALAVSRAETSWLEERLRQISVVDVGSGGAPDRS